MITLSNNTHFRSAAQKKTQPYQGDGVCHYVFSRDSTCPACLRDIPSGRNKVAWRAQEPHFDTVSYGPGLYGDAASYGRGPRDDEACEVEEAAHHACDDAAEAQDVRNVSWPRMKPETARSALKCLQAEFF